MRKAERTSRNVLLPMVTASLWRCREGLQQRRELCVAMFTTARGQNRTFFPPANCLISCCRWRAGRTIGEENRPMWVQGRAGPRFICLKLCDGFRLAPLWSFVEIPNGGIWRCLSTVPFFKKKKNLLHVSPSAISSCSWHSSSACHCLFCCPRRRKVKDESRRLCDYRTRKIAKAAKRSLVNLSF